MSPWKPFINPFSFFFRMDKMTLDHLLSSDPNAAAIVRALQQGVRTTEQLIAIVPYPETFGESMNLLIAAGIIGPPE